ncbi:Bacterial transcriptional regulator [compost metagenome]
MLELFDIVQADRQRGHVLGEGFFEAGISTVAAPVRDHSGKVIAALGATIPSAHIQSERTDELVRQVRHSASELSRLLNYNPNVAHAADLMRS